MKSRYDMNPGKDAAIANERRKRMEAMHSEKNAFVKRQQEELARHAGGMPQLKADCMEFNAYMCYDGMKAQESARKVTAGMDKVAYPLK